VTGFYLATNFVVYGAVSWNELTKTSVPLVLVGAVLFGAVGALIMSVGALLSVSGSDESGILGTARLSYAMAVDGLFPKIFARVHSRFGTPHAALIIQSAVALGLSLFSGISGLISFSVFNLSFAFLLTCLALIVLSRKNVKSLHGQSILPWIGIAICLYLIYSTSAFDKIVGMLLILVGIPIYIFFSPKVDIHHLKRMFVSEEAIFERRLERKERFLAHFIRLTHRLYKRMKE